MTWRAAIKLAYDGRDFFGSQRQPGVPTVEDEVIRCLRKVHAIEDAEEARFKAASRTDRGVSALGNVMAFDTSFRKGSLIQALNATAEKVYFYGLAAVPFSFTPRRARSRWYRYYLPSEDLDLERVEACAQEFIGKHDFRRFCKADGRPTYREVRKFDVLALGNMVVLDMEAREFLRNMVRRMVAAIMEVGAGSANVSQVRRALDGEDVQFGLAAPENLCLMDVDYGFDFISSMPTNLRKKIIEGSQGAFVKLAFFDSLASRAQSSLGTKA